jgi:hypothetical protein
VTCYNCNKLGHYAWSCPEKVKNKANKHEVGKGSSKKDISQVECHECRKLGHYLWDCLEKKKGKGFVNNRYIINEEPQKVPSQVMCFNCCKPEHYANWCPEKFDGREIKLVTCFKCGNQGHYANNCPKPVKYNGNKSNPFQKGHVNHVNMGKVIEEPREANCKFWSNPPHHT